MPPFERKRARVMFWMFASGWLLLLAGLLAGDISRTFAWWNVVPFGAGWLLLFISAPYVNGRLWGWMWRNWFGGSNS